MPRHRVKTTASRFQFTHRVSERVPAEHLRRESHTSEIPTAAFDRARRIPPTWINAMGLMVPSRPCSSPEKMTLAARRIDTRSISESCFTTPAPAFAISPDCRQALMSAKPPAPMTQHEIVSRSTLTSSGLQNLCVPSHQRQTSSDCSFVTTTSRTGTQHSSGSHSPQVI